MAIILLSILVGGIILVSSFNMFNIMIRITPSEEKGETIGYAIWVFLMEFTVIYSFIAAVISNV